MSRPTLLRRRKIELNSRNLHCKHAVKYDFRSIMLRLLKTERESRQTCLFLSVFLYGKSNKEPTRKKTFYGPFYYQITKNINVARIKQNISRKQ